MIHFKKERFLLTFHDVIDSISLWSYLMLISKMNINNLRYFIKYIYFYIYIYILYAYIYIYTLY